MKDDTRRNTYGGSPHSPVSRRQFLEHTAAAGGAAIVGVSAKVNAVTTAQEGKTPQPTPPQLKGEMIEYKSADLMIPAYLSRPKTRRIAPGSVLVIHEVFGLNDHIKSIADRIANEGYVALAPDFFVRAPEPPPKGSADVAAIRKAASSIPPEAFVKDMLAGLDYLRTVGGVRARLASVGFCMGGGYSYRLAAANAKDLAGAVIFYGRTPLELVPQVSCPLLGNFGALDTGIPPAKVKELEEALKKAGKQVDIKIYEGAGHAFFNDTRPQVYNAEAAVDAWQRTLKFFRERLGT
jgi:carboxymethylenebutenolidase